MRLHRLELAGVGSFADTMEIDFGSLSHAGLFLIEGPTGSGKSTILDAVVFALYGSVAGTSSDAGRLDSHMRTGSPFVELDFEVSGTCYRVRRSPAHQRSKKRGDGTTSANATASLLRLGPEAPVELANRASDVSAQVQALVGLDKDQFASTVVLAQGEFASFLDARTEDRRAILERVFGTAFYRRVEDQLHAMRREAREACRAAAERVDQMMHECCGILDVDPGSEEPLTQIDRVLADLRTDLDAATVRSAAAEEALQAAAQTLADATRRAADQVRKREQLAARAQLASLAPQVEAWQDALRGHVRAEPLGALIADCQDASERADRVRLALAEARAAVVAAGESEQAGQARLQEVLADLGRLEAPARDEAGLAARREKARQLQEAADDAAARTRRAGSARDEIAEQWRRAGAELAGLPDRSKELMDLQRAVESLVQRRERARKAQALGRDLAAAQMRLHDAEATLDEAIVQTRAGEEALRRNHAVALAAALREGQPCVVCGSLEHPAPARGAGAVVDLDALRVREESCRREVEPLRSAVATLRGGLAEYAAEELVPAAIEAELHARIAEKDQAQAAQDRRLELQDQIDALMSAQAHAAEQVGAAALAEQDARGQWATAGEALAETVAGVVAARGDFDTVAERIDALAGAQCALQALMECRGDLETQEHLQAQTRKSLDRALAAAGFTDVAEAERCLLADEEVAGLREEVASWETQTAQVAAGLHDLGDVDLEERIDVAACESLHDAAGMRAREAHDEVSRLTDRWRRVDPRRDELARRIAEQAAVRGRTEAVIRMADLATASRNEVTHKIRLSSFVLMRRFEDVVNAANDRLDTISEGRYQLQVETHGLDARSQAGLDLRVYDGRSDTFRSTRSLSGGERFYVSLGLALGLADVVRSESGGIELGTLFIDEGFGSLDDEVLEEVMDMLEQVRVGEDRVIGLISHVEVLKQRIDPRISVRRDPERPGVSTLEVHV